MKVPAAKQKELATYQKGCEKYVTSTNSCGESAISAEEISTPQSTVKKNEPAVKSLLFGCAETGLMNLDASFLIAGMNITLISSIPIAAKKAFFTTAPSNFEKANTVMISPGIKAIIPIILCGFFTL